MEIIKPNNRLKLFLRFISRIQEQSFSHPYFHSIAGPQWCLSCIRKAILNVWSVDPREYPRLFQGVHEVKNIFTILLQHYLLFTLHWHLRWFAQKHWWVKLLGFSKISKSIKLLFHCHAFAVKEKKPVLLKNVFDEAEKLLLLLNPDTWVFLIFCVMK